MCEVGYFQLHMGLKRLRVYRSIGVSSSVTSASLCYLEMHEHLRSMPCGMELRADALDTPALSPRVVEHFASP